MATVEIELPDCLPSCRYCDAKCCFGCFARCQPLPLHVQRLKKRRDEPVDGFLSESSASSVGPYQRPQALAREYPCTGVGTNICHECIKCKACGDQYCPECRLSNCKYNEQKKRCKGCVTMISPLVEKKIEAHKKEIEKHHNDIAELKELV